jgi:hypothetical protein
MPRCSCFAKFRSGLNRCAAAPQHLSPPAPFPGMPHGLPAHAPWAARQLRPRRACHHAQKAFHPVLPGGGRGAKRRAQFATAAGHRVLEDPAARFPTCCCLVVAAARGLHSSVPVTCCLRCYTAARNAREHNRRCGMPIDPFPLRGGRRRTASWRLTTSLAPTCCLSSTGPGVVTCCRYAARTELSSTFSQPSEPTAVAPPAQPCAWPSPSTQHLPCSYPPWM